MRSHDLDPGNPLTLPSTAVDTATLAGLLTHAHDAIVIRRLTGEILYWNQGAERIYGWPAADALGQVSHILLKTRFPAPLVAIDALLRERGEWAGRLVHLRRDGTEATLESRWAVSADEDREIVLEINRDITSRLQAEEAARTRERQLRFVTDSAPVAIAHCDREHRFKFVNRSYAARFGLRPDQLADRRVPDVLGAAAFATIEPYLERVLAGERVEVEREIPYESLGRQFMRFAYEPEFDDAGRVVGYVAAIVNVSDRRYAEQAERQSRERLEFVLNSTEVGSWHCDLPFDVLVWNSKCKEHFGLPADARVTIETFYDRLHPDDRAGTRSTIEDAIAGETPYDTEYRTLQPDGSCKWIRALGRVACDEHGSPVRFDGITVDITAQKDAERQLREADRRKDAFLATLAHELRNPLAAMRNAAGLLVGTPRTEVTTARAGAIITRQLERLVRLVDDLLDVSRISRGQMQLRMARVELGGIVRAALESIELTEPEAAASIRVRLPADPLVLEADAERLAQVFINLVSNALKYTPPGGTVDLAVDASPAEITVTVADTGAGIPPEMLEHVFDMFAQVDRGRDQAFGGLGIGLTLVRSLVELHGGTITAQSDGVNRGSTFVVRLPRPGEAEPPAAPTTQKAGQAGHQMPRRVLIADDNLDAAESLQLWLEMAGHDVHVAHDGHAAVAAAESLQPEVVLLDLGMPGLSGLEAARSIRQTPWGQTMVLIALTGWGQEEDRRQTREAGFDHHLIKPVSPDEIEALVRSA